MNTQERLVGALVLLVGLVGCQSPEPVSPSPGITNAVAPSPPDLGRGPARATMTSGYNMFLGEEVQRFCSGTSPFFAFDSSDTRGADQPTMQLLADCMTTGPLKGKSIKLIGHTDPRGTPGYNLKLGLERADKVKQYLVTRGIDASRITTTSLGEDEASPSPADWPKDRRVEIQLAR